MDPLHEMGEFRRQLVGWLDAHLDDLTPANHGHGTLDDHVQQFAKVKRALFDAGYGRYGWPEHVGGLGGSPLLRAIVSEEIAARYLTDPGPWSMTEVLAPTVITFGAPELVATMVPPLLRGDETWCQGFSEPGSGSDLASLTCRATRTEGGFLINGQKVWTSYAQYAERCILLARTGEPGSAHRGITAFFVDVDSPGIEYRPIEVQNGRSEFAEVFYDDVFVPDDRVLGEVNGGWTVAMDILPYERSSSFWHRGACFLQRVGELTRQVSQAGPEPGVVDEGTEKALGEAYLAVLAFRCRSKATQHRLAAGDDLGASTSIDKVLVATADQTLFDVARDLLPGAVEFGDDTWAAIWRSEFLYSKAATIYGGTSEIQRNIIARRLLDMGAES